jgi:ferritin-like metal-binding protein YciE
MSIEQVNSEVLDMMSSFAVSLAVYRFFDKKIEEKYDQLADRIEELFEIFRPESPKQTSEILNGIINENKDAFLYEAQMYNAIIK